MSSAVNSLVRAFRQRVIPKREPELIKYVKRVYDAQTLWQVIKGGGWRAILDGSLGEQLIHGWRGAKYVGTDKIGNRYFENMNLDFGRHRWVMYSGSRGNQPGNTQAPIINIPVEWYNWLHSINANAPPEGLSQRPVYFLDRRASADVPDLPHQRYLPKGAWSNAYKRNWQKTHLWNPSEGVPLG
eukprot:jgi/Botrbrau1/15024/Bobra.320_2s0004.1